jgi:DNA-binding HxlR family transcriptional regulator
VKRAVATREKRVCIAEAVESIVRCKWSLQLLGQIRRGVTRPGALVRACHGLSTKVLNERLARMIRFGILERVVFPEVPPRVEYRLTDLGGRFVKILDAIEELQLHADARRA